MISFDEALIAFNPLEADELKAWIEQRWVLPAHGSDGYQFSEVDMARLHLVHDIRYTFEVELESVSLVLSLVDQVYATRRQMHRLAEAVATQPDDVRLSISQWLDQPRKTQTSE